MKRLILTLTLASLGLIAIAQQEPSTAADEVARDVAAKIGKISSFSATVETREFSATDAGEKSISELVVSRLYGWKLTSKNETNPFSIITDFNTFYQYFPKENRVMKTTADSPELKAMVTKPVTDMNPLRLLDRQSLEYHGQEKFNGETVYRVEGTTESQLMPGGADVKRTLSVLISVEDGLPRKTVESIGVSTGTTIYRNVKTNLDLTPKDFSFTPPPGVAVIDTNAQMRRVKEQMSSSPNTSVPLKQ